MNNYIHDIERRMYPILRKKQLDVAFVPIQEVGPFTGLYRRIVPWVKVSPWRIGLFWVAAVTIILRILLGSSFVVLASILQSSF